MLSIPAWDYVIPEKWESENRKSWQIKAKLPEFSTTDDELCGFLKNANWFLADKLSCFGNLPGDLKIERNNFRF